MSRSSSSKSVLNSASVDNLQYLPPNEISRELVAIGEKKSKLSFSKQLLSGFLAGAYIAFASHLYTLVTAGATEKIGFGPTKFLGGLVFSTGLMLVLIVGAELFTGNVLMIKALLQKKISLNGMLRNWSNVYFANLIGSLILVLLIMATQVNRDAAGLTLVGENAVKIASAKAALPISVAFFRGIAANWLVCLGVMMSIAAKNISGKVLAIIFPIMAFVAMGFEHSVANMYLLPAGMMAAQGTDAVLNIYSILINLLVVTAGNIVGGGFFVATIYWYLNLRSNE
ncbi:MAG: formate/nitrite transporter family protein [Patescibacteria group bacterium]